MSTVTIQIPGDGGEDELVQYAKIELALALYREGKLSPGNAGKLAGLGRWEFADLAKARQVFTPYSMEMVNEDFSHGSRN